MFCIAFTNQKFGNIPKKYWFSPLNAFSSASAGSIRTIPADFIKTIPSTLFFANAPNTSPTAGVIRAQVNENSNMCQKESKSNIDTNVSVVGLKVM